VSLLAALAVAAPLLGAPSAAPAAAQQDGDQAEAGRHHDFGDAEGIRNILPPGQDGMISSAEAAQAQTTGERPEHFDDQVGPYYDLLQSAGLARPGENGEPLLGVTDGDLPRFYKDASFGTDAIERAYSPTNAPPGLRIVRGSAFGVPHIFGETREAAMFGAGYTGAEDRLFLMDVLRHTGRARLSEFLGASEANKAMDRGQLLVAPYRGRNNPAVQNGTHPNEFTQQIERVCDMGERGAQLCDDLESYIAGVNQYIAEARRNEEKLPAQYTELQQVPEDFIAEDLVAIASLVGGIFGKGGGGEASNSVFRQQLRNEGYSNDEAQTIFDDFRSANDPEAPVTTVKEFPYNNHGDSIDPDSNVALEPGTLETQFKAMGPDGDSPMNVGGLTNPLAMSNAILASGDVSDGGVPSVVFGPQTGYFVPQLLVEKDIHAPGIDARGVSFAGTDLVIELGRGRDYAWSATSAGADNVDEWALELCEPDGSQPDKQSTHYLYDGECVEMDTYTHREFAKPSGGGVCDPSATDECVVVEFDVERAPSYNDAPVVGRAKGVDGNFYAIAEQRSTFKREIDSIIGFSRINDPTFMTDGAESFKQAFEGVDYTFNWFYADNEDIAYKQSCRCPIRDPQSDPDLLTIGNGEYDWTGNFLAPQDQPNVTNPERDFLISWNNKQARKFRSSDSTFSESATFRSEFLRARLEPAVEAAQGEDTAKLTRGDMVNIMEDAGTVDLNAQEIYPLALAILNGTAPPDGLVTDDATLEAMAQRLAQWVRDGGHRRDLDQDGDYDNAVAVAIGDATLRPMLDEVYGDELGDTELPQGVENHPRSGLGSAYNGGQADHLDKDFRQVLGQDVEGAYSRTYCGGGDKATCADVLWTALSEAAELLSSPRPDNQDSSCLGYPDEYKFGSDNPEDWVYDDTCDNISQTPVGVTSVPDQPWINRPTFQQVMQVGSRIGRIDGPNRIETSARISRQAFASSESVVVAPSTKFADALSGTPLADEQNAPLLLSNPDRLPAAIAAEVGRLGAESATVLGGTAALSEQVEADLEDAGVSNVTRIGGEDRFDTAKLIHSELGSPGQTVVASGERSPDALAAGPFAGASGRSILLTAQDQLPDETAAALDGVENAVIAGGPQAITREVEDEIAQGRETRRVFGDDRYATAAEFAEEAVSAGLRVGQTYVASGRQFPDALSAGASALQSRGVLTLLDPARLDLAPESRDFLSINKADIDDLWLAGGQVALPSALREELEPLIARAAGGPPVGGERSVQSP
jgi:acyl-homoserine lactone acylase PvdQ/putative cell wall-binding protein